MTTTKKLTLTLSIIATASFAQRGQKWATDGNASASTDFLGTLNQMPLIFKTNATQAGMFDVSGGFSLTSLKNGTKGLTGYDGNGKLFQIPFTQNSNQVLAGDGSWINIPNITNGWRNNGTSLY